MSHTLGFIFLFIYSLPYCALSLQKAVIDCVQKFKSCIQKNKLHIFCLFSLQQRTIETFRVLSKAIRNNCYKEKTVQMYKIFTPAKKIPNKCVHLFDGSVSQKHRIAEVGRDLQRSSKSNSTSNSGSLQQVTQASIQAGSEYFQRRRSHYICGWPLPVPCKLHSTLFLMFMWSFLCSSLNLLPLVLSLGTTEKSLIQSSLHPPFRYVL